MSLTVFAELMLTVIIEINGFPCENDPWAEILINTGRWRKHIEPKNGGVDKFDYEPTGLVVKRYSIIDPTGSLFSRVDQTFYFSDMFITEAYDQTYVLTFH